MLSKMKKALIGTVLTEIKKWTIRIRKNNKKVLEKEGKIAATLIGIGELKIEGIRQR